MKRENIVGRANVDDTPALEAYYAALEGEALGALWNVANEIEPWYPQPKSVPILWKWKRIEPLVRAAPELVSADKAARRVVMLVNPGRKEWSAAAGLLYTGVQIMNPGEFTSAHRHQASALRFIMDGRGAYTVVDGERMTLGPRDLVLTPNGTWHDHGIEAGGTQCVWQDGLDIPLMNALDANFFEVHPQTVQKPAPLSRENWAKPYSPTVPVTRGTRRTRAVKDAAWTPFDGRVYEYRNPLTGGPIMPTIGAQLQLLAQGETRGPPPHRQRDLPGRAGPRLVRDRGRALRLGGEGHLRPSLLGAALARQRRRDRGGGAVLVQRLPGDARPRALSRSTCMKTNDQR